MAREKPPSTVAAFLNLLDRGSPVLPSALTVIAGSGRCRATGLALVRVRRASMYDGGHW